MPNALDRHTFYSALLLALRELRQEPFEAEGSSFHRAFLAVIEKVKQDRPFELQGLQRIKRDPVFGFVKEANEMILEAEHDRILSLLNPRLKMAQFKISSEQARRELEKLVSNPDCFRDLARVFDEQLGCSDEQSSVSQPQLGAN